MHRRLYNGLPETGLIAIALFFTYRSLGTFPGSWVDEGLFTMVSKMIATGHGYAIPLLDHLWYYPYFLAVGPTVIVPSALSMKLLGFSVAAARIPMTLYILASCLATYVFTLRIADRRTAQWTTALLVTLSAFVNTGKPVLGEVPAFFFLMAGCIALVAIKIDWRRGCASGALLRLSIMTKLTYGLILPALGAAWAVAVIRRQWRDAWSLTLSGCVALLVYLPWRLLEAMHTPAGSLTEELDKFVLGGGDLPVLAVLRTNSELLLRLPFLAFGAIVILGIPGVWSRRLRLPISVRIFVSALVLLFTLYFLNSYGWYRHLLPAHLLLLPFVPEGTTMLARYVYGIFRFPRTATMASCVLMGIAIAQGIWQLQHRGSGFGNASAEAARILQERYADADLLIEESELFAQLPENPHWLYLVREHVSPSMPALFRTPNAAQRCFTHVRKLNEEEIRLYGKKALPIGSYHLLPAPVDCR